MYSLEHKIIFLRIGKSKESAMNIHYWYPFTDCLVVRNFKIALFYVFILITCLWFQYFQSFLRNIIHVYLKLRNIRDKYGCDQAYSHIRQVQLGIHSFLKSLRSAYNTLMNRRTVLTIQVPRKTYFQQKNCQKWELTLDFIYG